MKALILRPSIIILKVSAICDMEFIFFLFQRLDQ